MKTTLIGLLLAGAVFGAFGPRAFAAGDEVGAGAEEGAGQDKEGGVEKVAPSPGEPIVL